jgi:thiol-disulfide isomerase/thioredoxin
MATTRWRSALIAFVGCHAAPRRAMVDPVGVGAAAPDVTLTAIDGPPITLHALRGELVVLDFWQTTCAPCVRALPALVELDEQYHGDAVRLISVTPEPESAELREVVATDHMTWTVATDVPGASHAAFRVDRYPMYFVIDEAGTIVCARCSLEEVSRELRRRRPRGRAVSETRTGS